MAIIPRNTWLISLAQTPYAGRRGGLGGQGGRVSASPGRQGDRRRDRADRQHRHPRLIATEMVASMPEKALTKVTSQVPAGPLAHRDRAARVVHCLAADAS